MDEQLELIPTRPAPKALTLAERFSLFHQANPHVYTAIERKARALLLGGRGRMGIAEIVEELRYDYRVQSERGQEDWKINNSFRAFYARMLVDNDPPAFTDVIELRIQKAV